MGHFIIGYSSFKIIFDYFKLFNPRLFIAILNFFIVLNYFTLGNLKLFKVIFDYSKLFHPWFFLAILGYSVLDFFYYSMLIHFRLFKLFYLMLF
jgi:hypothetical protein